MTLPTQPSLPRAGESIGGRYRVVRCLGQGGMGAVFLAHDAVLEREVAIKLLLSPDDSSEQRFAREGELTAALRHPGIVSVHGSGRWGERPYLVFDLVPEARSLTEAARDADLRTRVGWVRDAARAVGVAHAQGIVHRDLKPDNLLIDADGALRVADFGVASASSLERLTLTGALVGTPQYMAPEQVEGKRDRYGPPTDVWALGAVLYQLLTDRLPFPASNLLELMARIQSGALPRPRELNAEVPPALEATCLRALKRRIESRFPDGESLAVALDEWLGGRASRGRRGIAAAAVVGASLGLFALVWTHSPGPPTDPLRAKTPATRLPGKTPRSPVPVAQPQRAYPIGLQLAVRRLDGTPTKFRARHVFLDAEQVLLWQGGGTTKLQPTLWRPLARPVPAPQELEGELATEAIRIGEQGVVLRRLDGAVELLAPSGAIRPLVRLKRTRHVLTAWAEGEKIFMATRRGRIHEFRGGKLHMKGALPWPKRKDGELLKARRGLALDSHILATGFGGGLEAGLIVVEPRRRVVRERRDLGAAFPVELVGGPGGRYAMVLGLGRVVQFQLGQSQKAELRADLSISRTMTALAYSPDGRLHGLEVVRPQGEEHATAQSVLTYDVRRRRVAKRWKLPPGVPYASFEFSPDGEHVLLMREDGWVEVRPAR